MTRFHAPISEQIWDMKYRFKDAHGKPIDQTVDDTWARIATDLAFAEPDVDLSTFWSEEFYKALEDWKYTPAGRVVAGAGTGRAVTLFNCFVMGTVPDSMSGIFAMLREAALTMQQGGGIGYDFSTIRPKTSLVKKLGADASGPLSFMDCWDAMCRTVMSAGSRRGAMMATMRCDHPDIEDFITAKQDSKRLRMFNLSVLVTDAFMEAVRSNSAWDLVHTEPSKKGGPDGPIFDHNGQTDQDGTGLPRYIHSTVRARDLWDLIMRSTYDAAEPGVIFIDRVNEENNLRYCETIASTNPCGEQPLPPYGACLLGSINLAKLIENPFTGQAGIDQHELRKLVGTAVRMMDNVIEVSNFPLEAQEKEAKAKRRIGLGVTGLADALVMCKLVYGSEEACKRTEEWMRLIDTEAYAASVELAQEKGAFPLFDANQFLAPGTHASTLPIGLQAEIRKHGIRNALLTSIAPTGTISLYAGNVSSGIEPIFAYSYTRKVLQPDGNKTEELVEDYAVAVYREHWNSLEDFDEDYGIDFDPDVHLPDYFVSAQTLSPMDHVRMQAAAQKHVDSSISKTINCPENISFEDFKEVYMAAYESGCKGCTTYRPNDITGSILSVDEKPKEETAKGNLTIVSPTGRVLAMGNTTEVKIDKDDNEVIDYHIEAEMFENVGDWGIAVGMQKDNEIPVPEAEKYEKQWDPSLEKWVSAPEGTFPPPPKPFQQNTLDALISLPDRPEELEGSTYKIKVGDQKAVYLTINDTVESDGTVRPFEIFLRSSDPAHDEWMVALARMVSAIMRRPYDASFVGPELMRIASATTGGFQRNAGFQPSLVAAIGAKIKEHNEQCKLTIASPVVSTMEQAMRAAMLDAPEWANDLGYTPTEDAISMDAARAAQMMVQSNTSGVGMVTPPGDPCSNCGSYDSKHEGGCETCLSCGHSKCG